MKIGRICCIILGPMVAVDPIAAAERLPVPDVYILAGQSNMSGRGALADLTADERAIDHGIRLYGNDGNWRDAAEPLDDATGQVDTVSADRQAAVGPGLFFARAVRAKTRRPVVLVPCAKGGTSIDRWAPGGGRDTLYGSCIARVRAAGGRLAGLLWYQGESDAQKEAASAERWGSAFADLVAAFRRDLAMPRLPVAFVRIGDMPARPGDAERYRSWTIVQQQQARVGLRCVTMVSTAGLPRLDDQLHLTTAAQRVVGARLADAMRRLEASC